ncbi:MAG: PAS domain S-box protein [Candidatus Heimdallarchaeota archaeon]
MSSPLRNSRKNLPMSSYQQRYYALFEHTNDAVFLLSLDLVHLDVNQRAADLLGYSREELIGMSAKDIVVPQEYPDSLQVAAALEARKIIPVYERTFRKKDGSEIVMELNVAYVEDADQNPLYIQSVARDITDRKQAEQALRESEERFRTIFRDSNDGIAVVEITEDGHLGFIQLVNDAFCQLTGLQPTEINKLVPRDLVTPDEFERLNKEGIIGNWLSDTPLHFEASFVARDGTTKFAEVAAPKVLLDNQQFRLMMVHDITARKHAETALKESEKRYRNVVEQSIQGLAILQDGRIVFANPALAEMYGGSVDELLALSPEEAWGRIHPDDRERMWIGYQDRLDGKRVPARGECRIFNKQGQLRWILNYGTLTTFQGKPAIQSIYIDITDRKTAEHQLRRQKEELSEFAHAMNHDLRNSLLVINGFAALLQKKPNPEHADKIVTAVKSARELLQKSVELADAGLAVKKEDTVNLSQLIRATANQTIPADISFELDDFPEILCDRPKTVQIFQNLLENAVVHGKPTQITVRRLDSKKDIAIAISNNGQRIPPDVQDKIFQRGFTTKEEGARGGLGLAIVEKLVKAHNWSISLEDAPETTFRIEIPT